jgi:hypothetical protein
VGNNIVMFSCELLQSLQYRPPSGVPDLAGYRSSGLARGRIDGGTVGERWGH